MPPGHDGPAPDRRRPVAGAAGRLAFAVAATLALAGALAIRCRFTGQVFLDRHVLPYDPDSSYHLWRIEEVVRSGTVPRHDAFMNAPVGADVIWPDGFDAAVGWLARVVLGADASRFDDQVLALLVVPLLGVLAVAALYLLSRRVYGRAEAAVAALLAAVLPAHVLKGMLGLVDHHVLELLLPPIALAALLPDGRATAARIAVAVGALAALVLAVPAAPLHVAVIAGAAGVAALVASRRDLRAAGARFATLAAALAAAAALTLPAALSWGGLAFWRPSALPTVVLAGGAALAAALAAATRLGRRAVAVGSLVALAAALLVALWQRDALGFVARAGILDLVREAQPMWRQPVRALELHSALLPLVPVALVAVAWRRGPAAWGLAAAGLAGLALTVLQARFDPLLVPGIAGLAAGIVAAWRRARRPGRAAVAVACLGAMVLPARYSSRLGLLTPHNLALLDASDWLAAHTSPAGDRAARAAPAYTVLTMWGDGAHIAYLANRPVLAGAFYHGAYLDGVLDAARALYGDAPVDGLLDRRRVRYVVVQAQAPWVTSAHRRLLGLPPPAAPTLHAQLFDADGGAMESRGRVVPALGGFRLVHEALGAKIFERVAGARVAGSCAGGLVTARARTRSDSGRRLDWVAAAPCDAGRFALRVPYPGPVELAIGGARARVEVREADVRDGRRVVAP